MSRFFRYGIVLSAILISLGLARTSSTPVTYADTPITFSSVSPTIVALGSDYASEVRGYNWDFNAPDRYARELTAQTFVNGGALVNGMFVGKGNRLDPKIWLQDATIPDTIPTQNEGAVNPIDTSKYRYVTYRMCSDKAGFTIVYWHKDRSSSPGTFGAAGFKPVAVGCQVYSLDLIADRNAGGGSLAWEAGPIQAINIRTSIEANVTIKLDYVRLSATPPGSGPIVTAAWTPTNTTFDLYFDTTPTGENATLIAQNVNGSAGQYQWTTPNLGAGTYYFIARQGAQQSVSPAFTVNARPTFNLLAPSYTSGPDYATTVRGNAWDMNEPGDVSAFANISNANVANGIFSGTSLNGNDDPNLTLNTPTPIDPSRFYYATYRMRVLGTQDIGLGSVARLFWWTSQDVPNSFSVTQDVVVYEGWRTVTVDLRTALLEAGSHGAWQPAPKVGFRLDPLEFSTPHAFEVDSVLLTGNDQASNAFDIQYQAQDPNSQPVSVSFFYDTDRQGTNGTAIICQSGAIAPGTGSFKIYLPLVQTDKVGSGCRWNVGSIPNGDYYIYAVVNDGLDTLVRYSTTPVEVRH